MRDKVDGGLATVEVTNKGKGWHPHLHILMDCEWLAIDVPKPRPKDSRQVIAEKCRAAHYELSRKWAKQLGQEEAVTWIKRCNLATISSELLKYALKGSDLADSPDPIAPMLYALAKSRMVSAFGSWHGVPAPIEEKPVVICEDCDARGAWIPEQVWSIYHTRK